MKQIEKNNILTSLANAKTSITEIFDNDIHGKMFPFARGNKDDASIIRHAMLNIQRYHRNLVEMIEEAEKEIKSIKAQSDNTM